jgi:hypothetical protein
MASFVPPHLSQPETYSERGAPPRSATPHLGRQTFAGTRPLDAARRTARRSGAGQVPTMGTTAPPAKAHTARCRSRGDALGSTADRRQCTSRQWACDRRLGGVTHGDARFQGTPTGRHCRQFPSRPESAVVSSSPYVARVDTELGESRALRASTRASSSSLSGTTRHHIHRPRFSPLMSPASERILV